MSTILIKDSLRQSIEAASGGEQTVLYTNKGQPTFVNILKKFDLSTIDNSLSGTHPAFIIGGDEKDAIYIGTYPGVIKNGELLSLPNQEPTTSVSYDGFVTAAKSCGNGFHMITNAEWAAVALRAYKNGTQPLGNTYFGQSVEDSTMYGRRVDGKPGGTPMLPGQVDGTDYNAKTLTGSGPVKWRDNWKYNGISDLSGNINQFCAGVRLFGSELQIIENNNAAMFNADMSASSGQWKAIDAVTGNLIMPNGTGTTPGSVKFSIGTIADHSILVAQTSQLFGNLSNPSTTAPISNNALAKLKAIGIYPLIPNASLYGSDQAIITPATSAEAIMHRSASHVSGTNGGIFALSINFNRSAIHRNYGSRIAYYKP